MRGLDVLRSGIEKAVPVLRPIAEKAVERSPKLLLAAGVAGFVTTVVLTAKAAPWAKEVHDRFEEERADISGEDSRRERFESYKEEAKELAPILLPAFVFGVLSVSCFIGSSSVQAKRSSAVLAAYTALEKSVEANKKALLDAAGIDVAKEVENRALELVSGDDAPPDDSGGWYKDYLTGRYFKCDEGKLRRAESTVNKRLGSEVTVPLKEFYYELGLEDDTPIGDIFGFEAGLCPLDVAAMTMHPGTPMEYVQLCYRYRIINRSMIGG